MFSENYFIQQQNSEGNKQAPSFGNSQCEYYVQVIETKRNECPNIKNHSAVAYSNKIWLFGGYDGKKNHSSLYVYDILSNQWHKLGTTGDQPEGRNGHTASLIQNKMYVIGGWLGSGTFASSDLYILNLDTLEWKLCQTFGQKPGPCNMHSSDVYNTNIYIFRGGDGKDYLNEMHLLDTKNFTWSYVLTKGDKPPPRANHCSAIIQKNIYIFGGWNGTKRLNDLYIYNIESNEWKEVKINSQLPSPRAGSTMASVKNKLYIQGGSGLSASCFNDLQIFDPQSNTWNLANVLNETADNQIKQRAGHSMTIINDHLYIIGGSCGSSYLKDFFILDIDPAPPIIQTINQIEFQQNKWKQCMREQWNNPEFSDIQFVIQGKILYGHKVILSLFCERFKVMFQSGMKESIDQKIIINHIEFEIFQKMCQHLYTGDPCIQESDDILTILKLIRASDEFMLDEIKQECEIKLVQKINNENIQEIFLQADLCNCYFLKRYCNWFSNRINKNKLIQQQQSYQSIQYISNDQAFVQQNKDVAANTNLLINDTNVRINNNINELNNNNQNNINENNNNLNFENNGEIQEQNFNQQSNQDQLFE